MTTSQQTIRTIKEAIERNRNKVFEEGLDLILKTKTGTYRQRYQKNSPASKRTGRIG